MTINQLKEDGAMQFAIFDTQTRTYGSKVYTVQQQAADDAKALNGLEPCFRYAVARAPVTSAPKAGLRTDGSALYSDRDAAGMPKYHQRGKL